MDISKIKLDNEVLIEENEKLNKRITKLENNGIRKMDARLETLEEDMSVVWKILAKLENVEEDVKWIKERLHRQLLELKF